MKYKPTLLPVTKEAIKGRKPAVTEMIASVIADIAFNWGSYQYLGYTVYTCGNPKCSGTFRLTSKVCPRCGEEIDWEGIATRKVKVCPQCNLQFGKEDNYCPYHLPRVALIEKEIPK